MSLISNPKLHSRLDFEFVNSRVLSVLEKVESIIKPDDQPGISETKIESLKEIIYQYNKLKPEAGKAEHPVATLEEIEFDSELLKVLILMFEYINTIHQDRSGKAEKGSLANNQLTRFFIQLWEKFSLSRENLFYIYHKVFGLKSVDQEFVNIEDKKFAKGVKGVIESLVFLKEQDEFAQAKFHEPSLEEDMKHKVDLKCETEEELSLFQIKAFGRLENAFLFDLSSEQERLELLKSFRSRDRQDLEEDMKAVMDYAEELRAEERKNKRQVKQTRRVKAYWVQVQEGD